MNVVNCFPDSNTNFSKSIVCIMFRICIIDKILFTLMTYVYPMKWSAFE